MSTLEDKIASIRNQTSNISSTSHLLSGFRLSSPLPDMTDVDIDGAIRDLEHVIADLRSIKERRRSGEAS